MARFRIFKNVPVPTTKHDVSGRKEKYPFRIMEVGDCFYVPFKTKKPETVRCTVASAATAHKKRHAPEKKFTTRILRDRNAVGIWRTK